MNTSSAPPVGVATLVGREGERAKLAELVTSSRVVTLTGSGGCGKTRLAMVVVGDLASRFADGARWVDLQGVRDPGTVAPVVGAALGVQERPGQAVADTLAEALHARRTLVVLDNCEQVVEACAELVGTLAPACPQLHVLATSRVPLAVDGEASFEVAPLPVPAADATTTSTVASADAARLFELRARQVAGEFRIDDDNAPAVAEICRRLDGIPLAIELAAARIRVLAPSQIAAGLSDRFRLLTGGARGAPARQRTLEASLDWSYDLLDDLERLALARLSVFAGSFALDAAEAVVAGEGIDRREVLDLVAGLVEQSLVHVVQRQDSAHYRLLETIRAYARARLPELDDADRVRGRHLAFHVALAGRAQAGLAGAGPEPWVSRLAAGLDDLRAAMEFACASGDLAALVGLTEPIDRFWFDRAGSADVRRRLLEAVTRPGAPEPERVRALTTASLLALAGGGPRDAHRASGLAVEAARSGHADESLAQALSVRAQSGIVTGLASTDRVEADVAEAVELAEQCGDVARRAYVLTMAGWTLLHSGSIEAARRPLERAIEVCESSGFPFHLPAAHAVLGLWPVLSGDLDGARHHARRSRDLAGRVGRPAWGAIGLGGLGAADSLQGDHESAQAHLDQAQEVLRAPIQAGNLYQDEFLRPWLALAAHAAGDLDSARATAATIVRVARGWGSRWNEALGAWLLGTVALDRGDLEEAREQLEACRTLSTEPRLPFPLGRSLLGLADLAGRDDQLLEAWELAHDALTVLDGYGDRVGTAAALEQVARLAHALGRSGQSLRLLAAAHRFHTSTGIARPPGRAETVDRTRAAAEADLGHAAATAYWHAGEELTLAQAVAYTRRGRGERGRPPTGWESLTPVEDDVVRLVAEGLSNAAIGQRLFMSVNTVKKHLTHVYAKVDVEGRADLAAQAARRDP